MLFRNNFQYCNILLLTNFGTITGSSATVKAIPATISGGPKRQKTNRNDFDFVRGFDHLTFLAAFFYSSKPPKTW
jgi:hypothetical protein